MQSRQYFFCFLILKQTLDNVLKINELQREGKKIELSDLNMNGYEVLIFDENN